MKVITGFAAAFVALSLCVPAAQARDTVHHLSVKDAIEMGKAKDVLDGEIQFYFGDQSHPAVATPLTKGVVTNKKTNAVGKSDEEACNWAMLTALKQMQERAHSEGGNAVINIESYFKRKSFKSNTEFECHAGGIMADVALKGDVVKLKK
ncbi:MAG: excinuclease ATPase subunit [Betaproteobacteria bacterium]|nr:excinuclease ATPase subunit [Betaproteobacteria bacterium]